MNGKVPLPAASTGLALLAFPSSLTHFLCLLFTTATNNPVTSAVINVSLRAAAAAGSSVLLKRLAEAPEPKGRLLALTAVSLRQSPRLFPILFPCVLRLHQPALLHRLYSSDQSPRHIASPKPLSWPAEASKHASAQQLHSTCLNGSEMQHVKKQLRRMAASNGRAPASTSPPGFPSHCLSLCRPGGAGVPDVLGSLTPTGKTEFQVWLQTDSMLAAADIWGGVQEAKE